MDLILWRHAEADDASGDDDLERALTPKGERQAERMAEWLNRQPRQSTRASWSSPARALPADGRRRSAASSRTVDRARARRERRGAARRRRAGPRRAEPVLVVGHQPTLGLAASHAAVGQAQPWRCKKAAVWWLRIAPRDDDGQVVLQAVQSPDCL